MEEKQATIPPELENMLLEFTLNVIVEKPEDLVDHAADYFARLRDNRMQPPLEDDGSKENIAKILGKQSNRRGTVMGESFNPEEEDDDSEVEVYPKTDEERARIKERTEEVFLFRVLDDVDVNAVIDAMSRKEVKNGEIVIQQGDDGDFFYIIDNGYFDIFIKDDEGGDNCVGKYENSGFFGELALLHNQPRAATIKATSDGVIWAVGRKTFNRLIVKRAFEKRKAYMELLDNVSQLKPLTEYEKMQVADALIGRAYKAGEVIVHEGDEGDGMYFIVEGKVSVRKKIDDEHTKDLAELGPGQYFGELAIVEHQPRAATVTAEEPTTCAFLDVKAFERLLGPCMDIMRRHIDKYET